MQLKNFTHEPTNDLDITTLRILEDYLDSFQGIVIVVSHDRYFLDRTVRRIFAFEGNGKIDQHEGGYTDYANRKRWEGTEVENSAVVNSSNGKNRDAGKMESIEASNESTGKNWKSGQKKKLKFTYQEQKDYENIEGEMAALEDRIAEIEKEFLQCASDFVKLNALSKEKEEAEKLLEEKMERWMYLEELAARIENGEMVDI